MKKYFLSIIALFCCAILSVLAAEVKLGKPVDVQQVTKVADLLAKPEQFIGKTIRIEGKITEICQMMQCWIKVDDGSSKEPLQVKVEDGVIVFPKDGVGKHAVAQGEFAKMEMSKDQYIAQLQKEAKEQGKTADTSKINEGKTIYRINGTGAIIK